MVLELYSKVFQKLLYAKMDYFAHNNSTEIMNRISTDISSVSIFVDGSMMSVLSYVLQIISGIVGLFIINWKLACIVLSIVPVKYLLIRFFSDRKEEAVRQWMDMEAEFAAWFDDTVNGIREIKLWNLYRIKRRELRYRQKKVLELNKKSSLLGTYNASADSILQGTVTSVLYGIGGYLICQGRLTLGGITAFISYSNYVTGPIALVFNLRFIFAQIKPSIQRLQDFLKVETERNARSQLGIKDFCQDILFENIEFAYTDQPVIRDASFKICRGERIAIVGENGSGKSTLIGLLLRFLNPQKGHIYVDGIDIEEYKMEQYRELFSVVSQDIYLFKDTVRNNITMDNVINDEEFEQLCRQMNLQEFIEKLPQGEESMLEKNGENLSGGERQKIALIRAIVKDSPILILDEATANIDRGYDEFLHHYILHDFPDKTLIVITHKTENLSGMDKIYKVENHTVSKIK